MFSRCNVTKHPASNSGNVVADVTSRENARIGTCVNKHISTVGVEQVPVFVCLCSGCNHVTGIGEAYVL